MRVRQSLLNFATTLLFTAVTMTTGLFASPWLEYWLGRERFGAYRVVIDCQGYLTLLQFGLGEGLAPLFSKSLGRGDDRGLLQALAAGMRAYLRVALVMVAVGLALTPVVARSLPGLSPATADDLRGAWLVGLVGFLALALVPFRTLVEASQRGHHVNLLLIGQALVITGLALVLARARWGIAGQSLAATVGTWSFVLALAWLVARDRRGLLRAAWAEPVAPETNRALWGLSAAAFLISLSGRVGLMTDNLIVGNLLGAGTVTTLYFTQRLAVLAQSLLLGVGGAAWAGLAELHARGEHATFNRRLIELSRLVTILGVAGLAPIVAYNRRFVGLWMAMDPGFVYGGDAIIAVASVNAFLLALTSLWAWCFSATGQARRLVAPALIAAAINLAASVLLTRQLGPIGPLLGTTVALAGVSLWYLPWLLRRAFGTPVLALTWALVLPLSWGLAYGALLCWVAHHHPPRGWPGLIVGMGFGALGFLALSAIVVLGPEDRALWRDRLRGLRSAASTAA